MFQKALPKLESTGKVVVGKFSVLQNGAAQPGPAEFEIFQLVSPKGEHLDAYVLSPTKKAEEIARAYAKVYETYGRSHPMHISFPEASAFGGCFGVSADPLSLERALGKKAGVVLETTYSPKERSVLSGGSKSTPASGEFENIRIYSDPLGRVSDCQIIRHAPADSEESISLGVSAGRLEVNLGKGLGRSRAVYSKGKLSNYSGKPPSGTPFPEKISPETAERIVEDSMGYLFGGLEMALPGSYFPKN